MTVRRLVVASVLVFGQGACSKGCGEDVPDPDVCSGAPSGPIATVAGAEVGPGEAGSFAPFAAGDVVPSFVFTEAGAASLPIRFRLSGADVPRCVEHRTTLASCPAGQVCGAAELTEHVVLRAPLHTYPLDDLDPAAGAETRTLYLALDRASEPEAGARLELTSEIAGVPVAVQLWFQVEGPDAAPAPDGGPGPDGALPDAAL